MARIKMTEEELKTHKNAWAIEYRKKNAEKIKVYNAAYRKENAEKFRAYYAARYLENPEKFKEATKNWRLKNTDKSKACIAKWRANNKEKLKAYRAKWRAEHLEQEKETVLAWRKKNQEQFKKTAAEYRATHLELRRILQQNRKAKKKNKIGKLSTDICEKLLTRQRGKCAICRTSLKKYGYHLDHIIPISSRDGLHSDRNLQLTCPKCNLKKGNKDPIRFMQENGYLL